MIEKIIRDYESELKIMLHSNYPKELIIPQFFNYQKTLRDNLIHTTIKNEYNTVYEMFDKYIKKMR